MKTISILGSTGYIGRSTLDIIEQFPDDYKVVGLTAKENTELLVQQAIKFRPYAVAVMDKTKADVVSSLLKKYKIEVFAGPEGLIKIATIENTDLVVSALVGSVGLLPVMSAIKAGKNLAIANKEALVMAGPLILAECQRKKVKIIPIDSEHNAIFQCLEKVAKQELENIYLTASGGPFLNRDKYSLENVSPEEAINHPRWQMGKKISVDSATMMNKGLEVIEARYFFDIVLDKIKVVIHTESMVHGLIELIDGNFMAVLSRPDMHIPIQYALSYPERKKGFSQPLDISKIGKLSFRELDNEKFPCVSYAYEAIRIGGTMPAVLNASNEIAVENFLHRKIKFTSISIIIRKIMDKHKPLLNPSTEDILNADKWAREESLKLCLH